MNYSFQYIDIILLAMIAGFIFLRLRGILGKKTGYEGKIPEEIEKKFQEISTDLNKTNEKFDEEEQNLFLKGAQIAYETIITDFSDSDNKLIASKPLLPNHAGAPAAGPPGARFLPAPPGRGTRAAGSCRRARRGGA